MSKKLYQEIVNQSFSQHVQDWNTLSPLDPMKILSEGVSESLSAIGERQECLRDSILESLPTLFSFPPKAAQTAQGYFMVHPSPALQKVHSLAQGSQLRVCHPICQRWIEVTKEALIYPFFEFTQSQAAQNRISLSFQFKGTLNRIQFWFIPDATGHPSTPIDTRILINSTDTVFSASDLKINNNTSDFAEFGKFEIKLLSPVVLKKQSLITLDFTFEMSPPAGKFLPNLIEARQFDQQTEVELGKLEGFGWEEIRLPDNTLSPPEALQLKFPDEQVRSLKRIEKDILKIKVSDPARYENAFFYNGSRHSLIIPKAHRLTRKYNGGIQIKAPLMDLLTEEDPFQKGSTIPIEDNIHRIEELSPIYQTQKRLPRETSEQYLSRFYAELRSLNTQVNRSEQFFKLELKNKLLGLSPQIRSVEIELKDKFARIFLLSVSPLQNELNLSKELALEVNTFLEDYLPLDYQWLVLPFHESSLECDIDAKIVFTPERLGTLTEKGIKQELERCAQQLLLPPPFGQLDTDRPLVRSAFFRKLKALLVSSQIDNSHLRKDEVSALHGLFVHGDTSTHLETIKRSPGEILRLKSRSRVELTDANSDLIEGVYRA